MLLSIYHFEYLDFPYCLLFSLCQVRCATCGPDKVHVCNSGSLTYNVTQRLYILISVLKNPKRKERLYFHSLFQTTEDNN